MRAKEAREASTAAVKSGGSSAPRRHRSTAPATASATTAGGIPMLGVLK